MARSIARPELLAGCRSLGGCPTGEARITKGYRLKARYVIHSVGPIYRGASRDAELLASAVRNSLHLADEQRLKTIAFAAISTGAYGYPMDQAARVILTAIIETVRRSDTALDRVIVCLYDQHAHRIFATELERLIKEQT